jgi:hypothetical protein
MTRAVAEGRPVKITAKVTAVEFATLERLAETQGCSLSEIIRRALAAYRGEGRAREWQSRTYLGIGGGR